MSRSTVLVIDDEKDLLELVRYNLEKEHLDVITATDGQRGSRSALRHKPDLVAARPDDARHGRAGGLQAAAQRRRGPAACRSSC